MEPQINVETKNKKIKLDFKESKYATGRRKKSIARVWLKKGSGNIHINGFEPVPCNQAIQARLLERRVVIRVQIVNADNRLTAIQ